jgi:hypothetical protein
MPTISKAWHQQAKGAQGGPEALLRTGIGRAYYAAFRWTVIYLIATDRSGVISKTGEDHSAVRIALYNSKKRPERDAADRLERLRTIRNKADYQIRSVDDVERAHIRAVKESAEVIELLVMPVAPTSPSHASPIGPPV